MAVAADFHEGLLDDVPLDDSHSLLESSVDIHPACRLVESDVVTPVKAAEIEWQRVWSLEGEACCLWEIQMFTELGERIGGITQAVKQNEDVGWPRGC